MASNVKKVPFEDFRPKLRPGILIPHGHQIIYETKDGRRRMILPMELADLVLLAGGQYTLREIMENILSRRGSLHFKTLFKAIHQMRAFDFLENGMELESFQPFGRFSGLPRLGWSRSIQILEPSSLQAIAPKAFYVVAMSVLAVGFWFGSGLRWPLLSSQVLGPVPSVVGLVALSLSFSLVMSLQALLRLLLQRLLMGQFFGLYLSLSPFALSLQTGDEPVFAIKNRLYLTLYHLSIALVPLTIIGIAQMISDSSSWAPVLVHAGILRILFDLSPFSASELNRLVRNYLSLSDSDLLASCIRDRSILNLLSPQHEMRSRQMKELLTAYVWIWSMGSIWIGVNWLRELATEYQEHWLWMGLAWLTVLALLMFVVQRLAMNVMGVLEQLSMRAALLVNGLIRQLRPSSWTKEGAAKMIMDLPLFSHFSPQLLSQMIQVSELQHVRSGKKMITQGEPSNDLFVLLEGGMLVESTSPDQRRVKLSRLLPVSIFGEMAMFEDTVRSADVIASEASVVLRIPSKVLREAAKDRQYLGEIEAFKNAILVNQFFASAPMFRELSEELVQDIIRLSSMCFFKPGEWIFQHGDAGHTLFLLIRGSVEVIVGDKPVKIIRQGGFFGEIAVVADVPRTASVRSVGEVVALEIAAASLWGVLSKDIELAMFIETVGESRLKEDLENFRQRAQMKPTGT